VESGFAKQHKIPKSRVDLLFARRLKKITMAISRDRNVLLTILGLLLMTFGQTWVISYTGSVIGGFYQTIVTSNIDGFYNVLWKSVLVVLGSAIFDSSIKYVTDLLAWLWRSRLCLWLQEHYFKNKIYMQIQNQIDNPDQRITQDVDNFSAAYATICATCISAPLIIGLYTYLSWSKIDWYAPALVFAYFTVGFTINKLVMSPVVNIVYKQEKLEGDFRYVHMRVRSHAESIAIYGGNPTESAYAAKTFNQLLDNKYQLIKWYWYLNSTSNILSYIGSILNYSVVALPVIISQRQLTPESVAEASFQLIMLISGFSKFTNLSKEFSELAGYTSRLAVFSEMIEVLASQSNSDSAQYNGKVFIDEAPIIRFENVTCYTPKSRTLIKNLSFTVDVDTNLLIMGPSGSGKSSILRVLNEIWPYFNGTITKPGPECKILYLSQEPYLTFGSLKDQLIYPKINNNTSANNSDNSLSDFELIELLRSVDLGYVIKPYYNSDSLNSISTGPSNNPYFNDKEVKWMDILSPGEQQRLCIARLLYHKPQIAILDEATSFIDTFTEKKLYEQILQAGIRLISVGHRESLLEFHNTLLTVERDGQWEIKKLK
jgi:ATP-binding cassette subfamily D (ALD) protein 4